MPSSNPAFSRFGGAGNGQQNLGWGAPPQQTGQAGPQDHRMPADSCHDASRAFSDGSR